MNTTAIILAGGSGTRFDAREPKQFFAIDGRTLLEICLERFQSHPGLDSIVLVCPQQHLSRCEKLAAASAKVSRVLAGGEARQDSSALGVAALPQGTENVLIHDAARPLVPAAVIDRVLAALAAEAAVMPVLPAGDTTVRVDEAGRVAAVLDRSVLRRAQTPQGFRARVIRIAHQLALDEGFGGAGDDCSLVLRYDLAPVATVEGDAANIKITVPGDLLLAESLLGLKGKRQKAKGKR